MSFASFRLPNGKKDFSETVCGDGVDGFYRADFDEGNISFNHADFGKSCISFGGTKASNGAVSFDSATVGDGPFMACASQAPSV